MSTRLPLAPYFKPFSIRFSNRRVSSSRSPGTISGSAGAVISTATSRSRASVCKPSATWRTIGTRSTGVSGRRCARSSMRDSDSRSSISRAMRQACACMMPRKRSRAAGSSRAGPCSVSMKPVSAASGVRSSWLTLATKSARISSTRRIGVRSWTVMTTTPARPGAPPVSATGEMNASDQRVDGSRAENSMRCALPVRMRGADRLDQLGHAQRDRGRLAAAQRRRDAPRPGR